MNNDSSALTVRIYSFTPVDNTILSRFLSGGEEGLENFSLPEFISQPSFPHFDNIVLSIIKTYYVGIINGE